MPDDHYGRFKDSALGVHRLPRDLITHSGPITNWPAGTGDSDASPSSQHRQRKNASGAMNTH